MMKNVKKKLFQTWNTVLLKKQGWYQSVGGGGVGGGELAERLGE